MTAVRRAARLGGFVAITSAMLPAFALRHALARPRDRDRVRDAWVGVWSGSLLRLFGIEVDLATEPHASSARGRLVVANHRSAIDIAVLLRSFGGHMVSRADLSGWPLVGPAARSVGTIFVDRSSTTSGAGAIRDIKRNLDEGQTVILFPEGTTFEGDVVRPFHPGAFIAVLRTDAEIVPVGVAYPAGSETAFVNESFTRHLTRMAGAEPTRVVVRVGEPIAVPPSARAKELASTSRDAVQQLVAAARLVADAASRPSQKSHG